MVAKLTSQLGAMQGENSVGVEETEDSTKTLFGVVSNLFTNEVKNVENGKNIGQCLFLLKCFQRNASLFWEICCLLS